MQKLIFKCKNCGWEKGVVAQWVDLSPRYCGNAKCKYSGRIKKDRTSFLKDPTGLEIIAPKKPEPVKQHVPEPIVVPEPVVSQYEEKALSRKERKKRRGVKL